MYKKIVLFLLVGLLSCSLFVCAFASDEHAVVPVVEPVVADPLDMVMNYITSFGSRFPVFGFLTEQFYWGSTGATIAGASACVILGVFVVIKVWYWLLDYLKDLSTLPPV